MRQTKATSGEFVWVCSSCNYKEKDLPLQRERLEEKRRHPRRSSYDPHLREGDNFWDPPSPIRVYCDLENVPYPRFRYALASGAMPSFFIQIQDAIEERRINCTHCVFYDQHSHTCLTFLYNVNKENICRKFEPSMGRAIFVKPHSHPENEHSAQNKEIPLNPGKTKGMGGH